MMWEELFWNIFRMSLVADIIIAFVLAVRILLRKAPKKYSYALWAVVLFRLLCPVAISAPVSLVPSEVVVMLDKGMSAEKQEENPNLTQDKEQIQHSGTELMNGAEGKPESDSALVAAAPEMGSRNLENEIGLEGEGRIEALMKVLPWIWSCGLALMLAQGIFSYRRLQKQLVGAVRLRDNIYLADNIGTPFVQGIWSPRIYLQSTVEEKELEYIIRHEQHHIRRLDHVTRVLSYVALCIHWFNPLVWLAFLLYVRDMEMSCDEAVIRKMGGDIRADYSESLLRLAMGQKAYIGSLLSFGEGDAGGRIRNLARWKKPTVLVTVSALVICIAAVMFCSLNPMEKGKREIPAEMDSLEFVFGEELGLTPERFWKKTGIVPEDMTYEQGDDTYNMYDKPVLYHGVELIRCLKYDRTYNVISAEGYRVMLDAVDEAAVELIQSIRSDLMAVYGESFDAFFNNPGLDDMITAESLEGVVGKSVAEFWIDSRKEKRSYEVYGDMSLYELITLTVSVGEKSVIITVSYGPELDRNAATDFQKAESGEKYDEKMFEELREHPLFYRKLLSLVGESPEAVCGVLAEYLEEGYGISYDILRLEQPMMYGEVPVSVVLMFYNEKLYQIEYQFRNNNEAGVHFATLLYEDMKEEYGESDDSSKRRNRIEGLRLKTLECNTQAIYTEHWNESLRLTLEKLEMTNQERVVVNVGNYNKSQRSNMMSSSYTSP